MNLLIIGTAGFIGARTAQLALDAGHQVVGLDNLNDYYDPRIKHTLDLHVYMRTISIATQLASRVSRICPPAPPWRICLPIPISRP